MTKNGKTNKNLKEKNKLSEKTNVSLDDYRAALVKCEALRTEDSQLTSELKDSTKALSILKVKS